MDKIKIFNKLNQLLNNAYCPYSKFPVSAIIQINDDFFDGVNVENSSYPNSICAERVALSQAVTKGALVSKKIDIVFLKSIKDKFIRPCGMCLQVIGEFANSSSKIISFNNKGESVEYKYSDLIPHLFTKEDLV